MSYPPGYCACGRPAGPHHCKGDDNSPAAQFLVEAMFAVHACAECGTEDETVARGGTSLCAACGELSAGRARDEEKRLAALRRANRIIWAVLIVILAAVIAAWVLV